MALALVGPAVAAAPAAPRGDALTRALAAGHLTAAQYALERARSLFALRQVRARYGDVARPGPHAATPILRDLARRVEGLSGRERKIAEAILARPSDRAGDRFGDGYVAGIRMYRSCTRILCVFYVRRSADAPPLRDANGNHVPDQVDRTRKVMTHVWRTEVGSFGYRRPKSDRSSGRHHGGNPDGRLDVFLANVGAQGFYGYCSTDDPHSRPSSSYRYWDVSAYCVLDDDFSRRQFPVGAHGLAALKVTAAHEFFHAVQFAYDWQEDLWLMEGTAVWMEDEVYNSINDNVQYLADSPISKTEFWHPLDYVASVRAFQYGAWIFWRYLSEHYGRGIVRQVWRRADGSSRGPDDYSAQAVVNALAARGLSLADEYADFALANLSVAGYRDGPLYQSKPYLGPTVENDVADGVWKTQTVYHLSERYHAYVPGTPSATSQLQVDVNLAPLVTGPRARLVVSFVSGGPAAVYPISLDANGDGSQTVPYGSGVVSSVVLVLTNAGVDYRCWRGTNYSCQGTPLDDAPYLFRATVNP